jgi:hypothetical protein
MRSLPVGEEEEEEEEEQEEEEEEEWGGEILTIEAHTHVRTDLAVDLDIIGG